MTIFFIPYGYPSTDNPRLCPFLQEQVRALKKAGLKIVILQVETLPSSSLLKHTSTRVQSFLDDDGVNRFISSAKSIGGTTKYTEVEYYQCLLREYKKAVITFGKPDLLLANFSLFSGYAATKIGISEEIPVVVVEHYGHLLSSRISLFEKKCVRNCIENSNAFICISPALQFSISKIVGMSSDRIDVIPNFIPEIYKYKKRKAHNGFIFFSAGNLYKNKCFVLLIEAFICEFSVDEPVQLYIAGKGPEINKMCSIIERHNRSMQIKLLGSLNRDEMLSEYEKCDCFVLPSKYETFGIAYREAMAVGRPIISTNHEGIIFDWDDNNGVIVEKDNKLQLQNAMREVYSDYSRFDLEDISRRCIEMYGEKFVIPRLVNALKVAGGKKSYE